MAASRDGGDVLVGVFYGYCLKAKQDKLVHLLAAVALIGFAVLGQRALERTAQLALVALLVHLALRTAAGSKLTGPIGDISYGVYVFAFPVQQLGVQWGLALGWKFATHLFVSFAATIILAYLSWHLVEKRALLLKPPTLHSA